MRAAVAEVLAEKVDRGDLSEDHAARIGRQILRENAHREEDIAYVDSYRCNLCRPLSTW
jgi:hypothetical protein